MPATRRWCLRPEVVLATQVGVERQLCCREGHRESTDACSWTHSKPEAAPSDDVDLEAELSDEEWLTNLPARSRLPNTATFDADALHGHRAESAIKSLRRIFGLPRRI